VILQMGVWYLEVHLSKNKTRGSCIQDRKPGSWKELPLGGAEKVKCPTKC
jgi:hypothetical protein